MEHALSELEQITVGLSNAEQISRIARALSVQKRVEILDLLSRKNVMSVNEIARELDMPISSASMHVGVLEEVGLLACERMSSIHGTMKMCTRKVSAILFYLEQNVLHGPRQFSQHMPIGAYSKAEQIKIPCGLASQVGPIGVYNKPACFYLPERLDAQMVWLKMGTLTYEFSALMDSAAELEYLELSFEACTHAQLNDLWKTEIRISINGCYLGGMVCTCNADGRRGTFNPEWWPNVATQHGELIKWRVTNKGSFLQNQWLSKVTLNDLNLFSSSSITVEILIPEDSEYSSGLNLFGTDFGDYNQGIDLVIAYQKR